MNGGNNVDYLTRLLDYNNLLGGQNIQHQVYNPYLTAYQWQQWFHTGNLVVLPAAMFCKNYHATFLPMWIVLSILVVQ